MRAIAAGLIGVVFIWLFPYVLAIFGLAWLVATPLDFVNRSLDLGIGYEKGLMTIEPLAVQWHGSDAKTVTMKITNTSGDVWSRFAISCDSDLGQLDFVDESGVLPGQSETRTYLVDEAGLNTSTLTSVTKCRLGWHWRGKPKAFDAWAEQQQAGQGGWGNRLPEGATASVSMSDADTMAGGAQPNYIPADGVMDQDYE